MTPLKRLRTGLHLARHHDDLLRLAREAERQGRELNGIEPATNRGRSGADVLALLGSACALLDRVPRHGAEVRLSSSRRRPAEPPPAQPRAREAEGRPPQAVTELIALRDMVLAASERDGSAEALEAVGRKLGQVLEKQGVRAIEDRGEFDYRFQEVLDVRRTDDPAKDELVCETVRPGYALGDRVLRPQQVVVYRLED